MIGLQDLVTLPFRRVARLRHTRVFHPDGAWFAGTFRPAPRFKTYFSTEDVEVRLSKGTSTAGAARDVLGLAIRTIDADGQRWDFALATTLGRFLLWPSRSWRDARYSSLMPYRFDGETLRWISAHPDGAQPDGCGVEAMVQHVRTQPARFELTTSGIGGTSEPFAELTLTGPLNPASDAPIDPTVHHPAHVELAPGWVTRIRQWAYKGSRQGSGRALQN
ncbi:MAG: phosphodiesterase [Nocardiaceae bacterium]|nr:phosphodiesterase [Nocardiaceae bacterium]